MTDLETKAYFTVAALRPESWQRGDWGSPQSQRARFDVIVHELTARSRRGETVLDVGCGDGELRKRLYPLEVRYTGWDLITPKGPDCEQRDLMDPTEDRFDWVVASGLWTYRDMEWAALAFTRMFTLCTRGLIVNSHSLIGRAASSELALTPRGFLMWGLAHSDQVALRHDYWPGDMTLVVVR